MWGLKSKMIKPTVMLWFTKMLKPGKISERNNSNYFEFYEWNGMECNLNNLVSKIYFSIFHMKSGLVLLIVYLSNYMLQKDNKYLLVYNTPRNAIWIPSHSNLLARIKAIILLQAVFKKSEIDYFGKVLIFWDSSWNKRTSHNSLKYKNVKLKVDKEKKLRVVFLKEQFFVNRNLHHLSTYSRIVTTNNSRSRVFKQRTIRQIMEKFINNAAHQVSWTLLHH